MNRIQLEHIIRAASQISGDSEIVIVGRQAIHAQGIKLPPIAFQPAEARGIRAIKLNAPDHWGDFPPEVAIRLGGTMGPVLVVKATNRGHRSGWCVAYSAFMRRESRVIELAEI